MTSFDANKLLNSTFYIHFLNYFFQNDDVVFYKIQLFSNEYPNLIIEFSERYSYLAEQNKVFREESKSKNFPSFPPTKYFGNTDEKFLSKRKASLNTYFSSIFSDKEHSQLKTVKKWVYDLFIKYYKPQESKKSDLGIKTLQSKEKLTEGIQKQVTKEKIDNQTNQLKTQQSEQKVVLLKCSSIVDKYSKMFIDLSDDSNQNLGDEDLVIKEKKYKELISNLLIKSKVVDENYEDETDFLRLYKKNISQNLEVSQTLINNLITNII